MTDYYKILGVSNNATKEEINKSFRLLAKKYHPDINKSPNAEKIFCDIYEAYEILKDNIKRIHYDKLLYEEYLKKQQYNYPYQQEQPNQHQYKTGSINDDFYKWTSNAKRNANYYSKFKYAEFLNIISKESINVASNIAEGFGAIIIYIIISFTTSMLSIFEMLTTIAITVITPYQSMKINVALAVANLIISILFVRYYFSITTTYKKFWIYLKHEGLKLNNKSMYYFIYLTYSIIIFTISLNFKINTEFTNEQDAQITNSESSYKLYEYTKTFQNNIKNNFEIKDAGIVVVDMNWDKIESYRYDLPDSLLANNHSEVKTVIQIHHKEIIVGHYDDGADGIQKYCTINIIDFLKGECIYKDSIYGSSPPNSKTHHGSEYGSEPLSNIKDYILKHVKLR